MIVFTSKIKIHMDYVRKISIGKGSIDPKTFVIDKQGDIPINLIFNFVPLLNNYDIFLNVVSANYQ